MGATKHSDILSLPGIWDVVTRGDESDLRRYFALLAVATPFLVATVVLAASHQMLLLKAPKTDRRRYYRIVQLFPLVVACTCWLQIAAPKLALFTLTLQEIWEALALHYFGLAIVCLLGGHDETVKSLAGEDSRGMFGSRNRWCVPPCCCVVPVAPCLFRDGAGIFTSGALSKVLFMMEQYCWVAPVTAVLSMILDYYVYTNQESQLELPVQLVQGVQALSMFVCLQALFMLYKATHHPLSQYRTTFKFLGIKSMIALSMIQKLVVMYMVHTGLLIPPNPSGSAFLTPAAASTRLQALLLGAELPFLQMLVNRAFPVDELLPESHGLVIRTLTA